MRKQILLFAFALSAALSACSQNSGNIDNSNYYSAFKEGGSINWLRESDAVPVIIDELLKNGVPYHVISTGDLMKLNDSTRLVVTVGFTVNNRQYGFVYESSHSIPLDANDRAFLTAPEKAVYVQSEKDLQGKVRFMRIAPLPGNAFLLKQTVYWFQYDHNGTGFPVSKQVAQAILRQDVRYYLKTVK